MSEDILTELKADWMECACYEGSLSVDREVIDQAAAEIERLRARVEVLESALRIIARLDSPQVNMTPMRRACAALGIQP